MNNDSLPGKGFPVSGFLLMLNSPGSRSSPGGLMGTFFFHGFFAAPPVIFANISSALSMAFSLTFFDADSYTSLPSFLTTFIAFLPTRLTLSANVYLVISLY